MPNGTPSIRIYSAFGAKIQSLRGKPAIGSMAP